MKVSQILFLILMSLGFESGCERSSAADPQIKTLDNPISPAPLRATVSIRPDSASTCVEGKGTELARCLGSGKNFVVMACPRPSDGVSPDDQIVFFSFMVTPCIDSEVDIVSMSFAIEVPQGTHDEDMEYALYDSTGMPYISGLEIVEDSHDEVLAAGDFFRRQTKNKATIFMPPLGLSAIQVRIPVPKTGRKFNLIGWIDGVKMTHYNINLADIVAVDAEGNILDELIVPAKMRQLTVR